MTNDEVLALAEITVLDQNRNDWTDVAKAIQIVIERNNLTAPKPLEPGRIESKKLLQALLEFERRCK